MTSPTRRAHVADQILGDIRSGTYRPGERLPAERQLSETFGVSRPVIREALGMLASLGLVDIQVGRGAFVTNKEISEQSREAVRSLTDVTIAREVIESGAIWTAGTHAASEADPVRQALAELERCTRANMSTVQADRAFHRSIVGSVRSAAILELWEQLTGEIEAVVRVSPSGGTMDEDTLEKHRRMAGGVLGGDTQLALECCHELHEDYRQFLRKLLG